ncbi:MAG: transcription termination factor Rho, partial [Psychromonas sp.]
HLNRKLAEKRIYPAIDITRSGTRREELLTKSDELQRMWILRKILHPMGETGATEFMIDKLGLSKTNDDFFSAMRNQKAK